MVHEDGLADGMVFLACGGCVTVLLKRRLHAVGAAGKLIPTSAKEFFVSIILNENNALVIFFLFVNRKGRYPSLGVPTYTRGG